MEHPQEVIRMLFVALLLIFNIVIIYNFMNDLAVNNSYRIDNLKYNAIAARIIYSPDCYAAEVPYEMGGTRYQVHAGILDKAKLNPGVLKNCIKDALYNIKIIELATKQELITEYTPCINMLEIKGQKNLYSGTWCTDQKNYNAEAVCNKNLRKLLVIIKEGNNYKLGLAEIKVCAR